jgi:hypothetical protein
MATKTSKAATKKKTKDKTPDIKSLAMDSSDDRTEIAQRAASDAELLAGLLENLADKSRRMRQFSAATISLIAQDTPEILVGHIDLIIDALERPEAQTRWEILETLSLLAGLDPEASDAAVPGAELALFDEDSGTLRLSAVRFISAYGALDTKRAKTVMPLLSEAVKCYHGDPEFFEMLDAITIFAAGKIGKPVKEELMESMSFDANTASGTLGLKCSQIVDLCK